MAERQSHPITDQDLNKKIKEADSYLRAVKGKQDLGEIFREAHRTKEELRILSEAQALLLAIRKGLCLYLYFVDLLIDRSGLKQEAKDQQARGLTGITESARAKARFISAYGFFTAASWIVSYCDSQLKGKNVVEPNLESKRTLTVGNKYETDVKYVLSDYADALTLADQNGKKLVEDADDLLAVTKAFWKAVAEKAAVIAKEKPEFLDYVNTTFHYEAFAVTALSSENREEAKIVTFAEVKPNEVVGNEDVKIIILRQMQRMGLYDSTIQKNPCQEFGGLMESVLVDGPPGTGKTTLMRMGMTELKRLAEMIGMPYSFKSMTADQVKNEYYGKTAQLSKHYLEAVLNPFQLALMFLDDVDLLVAPERSTTGGADNDLMKALMDFLSGTGTNYTGNYCTIAATNKPTASDSALRQRFVYRAIVKGPVSWQEYADLVALELRGFAKTSLLEVGFKGYEPLKREAPKSIAVVYDAALIKKYGSKSGGTFADVGRLCEELRKKDPEFTGRSVKNAIQVAVAEAADFDIPEEWFANPDIFRTQSWERRLDMLKELYKKLTAEKIMMAIERQFEVEVRYKREAEEQRVIDIAKEFAVREKAVDMIKSGKVSLMSADR